MPMSAPLDTAGYLTRNAKEFAAFGKAWYGDKFESYNEKPKVSRGASRVAVLLNNCLEDYLCPQRLLPARIGREPRCATDLRRFHRISAVVSECLHRHTVLCRHLELERNHGAGPTDYPVLPERNIPYFDWVLPSEYRPANPVRRAD